MENKNRNMRIQGMTRSGPQFVYQQMGIGARVHGLYLFGTTKETQISYLQFSNEVIVLENTPGWVFDQKDVLTLEEAQKLLEANHLPLMRRNAMQGHLHMGCIARMTVVGPCDGAALYVETIANENLMSRQVSVIRNGGTWSGTIVNDSLYGPMTTLDIEAPSEDAVMQAIIAGLGGVRVRVG